MSQVLSKPEWGRHRPKDVEVYVQRIPAKPVVIRSVEHRAEYSVVEHADVAQSYLLAVDLRRCWMPAFTLPTVKAAWYFSCAELATPEQIDNQVPGVCILLGPPMRVPRISTELVYPVGPIAFMPWLKPIPGDSTPRPFFESIISLQGDNEEETGEEREEYQRSEPISLDASRTQLAEPRGPVTCIICLENPTQYKWYACHHESDGPALACLRCRNAICAAALSKAKSTKR